MASAMRREPTARQEGQFRGSCAGCWTSWTVVINWIWTRTRGPSRQSPS
ncbi:unnamed protein product [Ectocarpus sp. 12 AP-2014]